MVKWGFVGLAVLLGVSGCASARTTPAAPSPTTQAEPSDVSPELRSQVAEAQNLDRLPPVTPHGRSVIDHSGRKQTGRASFYASRFANRKMADGQRMNPNTNVAASKTLPLGTVAEVTNLENGRSAKIKVEDRGPYVAGRVVDLTPKVANQLGMLNQGVAPVVVRPIVVPQPNGAVKLGAGAASLSPQEMKAAASQPHIMNGSAEPQRASAQ